MKYLILIFLTILVQNTFSKPSNLEEKCCQPPKLFQKPGPRKLFCNLATGDIDGAKLVYGSGAKVYENKFTTMHYMMLAILQKDKGNIEAMKNMARAASERLTKIEKSIDLDKLSGVEKRVLLVNLDCLQSAWKNVQSYLGYYPKDPVKILTPLPPKGVTVRPIQPQSPPFVKIPGKIPKPKNNDLASCCPELEEVHAIYFKLDEYEINTLDLANLDKLKGIAAYLKSCSNCEVVTLGFTDRSGSEKYNSTLSYNRAESVLLFFKRSGFDISKSTAKGYGVLGRFGDDQRKVEIYLYKK